MALPIDGKAARAGSASSLDRRPSAGEHPFDAQDQLGRRERLGEVVVGADAKAGKAVGRVPRADRMMIGVSARPDRAHDGQAVDLWEHHVQDHQRGIFVPNGLQGARAVVGLDHP